jgi:hypothetical protein
VIEGTTKLPTAEVQPLVLEGATSEGLGEHISKLFSGGDIFQFKDAIWVLVGLDIGEKVVVLDSNVLGTGAQARSFGKLEAASIIFETLGKYLGSRKHQVEVMAFDFINQVQDGEQGPGSLAE